MTVCIPTGVRSTSDMLVSALIGQSQDSHTLVHAQLFLDFDGEGGATAPAAVRDSLSRPSKLKMRPNIQRRCGSNPVLGPQQS